MEILNLQESELGFAHYLTIQENWGLKFDEILDLYRFNHQGIFIAKENNDPVGIIFATAYDSKGFIGELIVEKSHRHKGIGSQLMKTAINFFESQKIKNIMLDSVPNAVHLYRKFGFKEVCKSWRYSGKIQSKKFQNIRQMQKKDWINVLDLDKRVFGADRSILLHFLFKRCPKLCWIMEEDTQVLGYIMARKCEKFWKVGPWITQPQVEHPEHLLQNLVPTQESFEVHLGVLDKNQKILEILNNLGISSYKYSIRMLKGSEMRYNSGEQAIGGPDRG